MNGGLAPGAVTRRALLDAAEVLFAERGVEGVSLREISATAGQANNSAVQYHFGDRQGLVRAVFERRFQVLDTQRTAMLEAAGRDPDLGTLVDILVRPFAEGLDGSGRHWVRFVARLHEDPRFNPFGPDMPYGAPQEVTAGTRQVTTLIADRLDLPAEIANQRFFFATTLVVHAVADREALLAAGAGVALEPAERFLDHLCTVVTALLAAPTA